MLDCQAQSYPKIEAFIQSGRFDLALNEAKLELSSKNDPLLNYYVGISYLESDFGKYKAERYLEIACNVVGAKPIFFFELGRAYHAQGKWEKAVFALNEFREKFKQDSEYNRKAALLINSCTTALNLSKIENVYETLIFSPYINTSYDDLNFMFLPQSKNIFVCSNRKHNTYQDIFSQIDFFPESERSLETKFYLSTPKGESKDTTANWSLTSQQALKGFTGYPLSVAADGKTFLFLGRAKDRKFDELYLVKLNEKNQWGKFRRLPNSINAGGRYFGATFVDAGRTIIFSSDRPGGYGGFDLYKVESSQGKWSAPVNLGPTINKDSDEVTPFMSADNQSLLFSSNRVGSVGGFDVFFSKSTEKAWSEPVNKGLGINSAADEIYFSVRAGSDHAIFASNRVTEQSMGGYDVYLALNHRPESRIAIVSGNITAVRKNDSLKVRINILPEDTAFKVPRYVFGPSKDGTYAAYLPQAKNYTFSVEVDGQHQYAFRVTLGQETRFYEFSQHIEVKDIVIFGQKVGETLSLSTPVYQQIFMDKKGNSASASVSRSVGFRQLVEKLLEQGDSMGYAQLTNLNERLVETPEQRGLYNIKIKKEIEDAFKNPDIDFKTFNKIGTLQGNLTGNEGIWKFDPIDSTLVSLNDPFKPDKTEFTQVASAKLKELVVFMQSYDHVSITIKYSNSKPEKLNLINEKIRTLKNYFDSHFSGQPNRIKIKAVENLNISYGDIVIEVKP